VLAHLPPLTTRYTPRLVDDLVLSTMVRLSVRWCPSPTARTESPFLCGLSRADPSATRRGEAQSMHTVLAIVEGSPLGLARGSVCYHAGLQAMKDALTARS
jgi:hypothetical protein